MIGRLVYAPLTQARHCSLCRHTRTRRRPTRPNGFGPSRPEAGEARLPWQGRYGRGAGAGVIDS